MSDNKKNTMTGNIVNKAKGIVVEDTRKAEALFMDAVKSRAYLYPIKGIYYFASHPELWKPLKAQLTPMLSTAFSVTSLMFIVAYLPQAAVLTFVNGPFAIISTILLVLNESSTMTNFISRGFFIEEALTDTFDGTLLARNKTELVSQGREVKSSRNSAGDVMARMGKVFKKPFERFMPSSILRYFIYLPLNMIPIVGTILFILLQARRFGPAVHTRFYQLKGWNKKQSEDWVDKKRAAYTGFAVPAVLLEMIPFVGIFFSFTNAVGAALWAADIEDGMSRPETVHLRQDELPEQETGVVIEEPKKEL